MAEFGWQQRSHIGSRLVNNDWQPGDKQWLNKPVKQAGNNAERHVVSRM
jgi:hypothetical protein